MFEFFSKLFSNDFMPHKMCFLEDSGVLWLSVVSDALICLAYYLIPFLLFYFTRKRRDITFQWIFVAFGAFILACGTTHLMDAVTVWNPVYRLEGVTKAVTALASITTFLMLKRMMPQLVALPRPAQLAAEIEERRAAEEQIRRINEELEGRVARRTAELAQSESMYRRLATEQKQVAESLERALEELRREMKRRRDLEDQLIHSQKMEAVGRLAGGVAHDFNNLLTVILGYNEMLREQVKGDPEALDSTQEVLQAATRASALTNQLLAFSRRQVAVTRIVNLNEVVRHIDKMLRRIIGEDVELETRLDPQLLPVKVDPAHMDQVIMNLAVNSRDALPSGGRLTIETANMQLTEEYAGGHMGLAPGPYVVLSVSDNGIGMNAETKARVFEPFFTTKEKGKGTGLGLSIVYGIVKQNGGEILLYSEPGQGTVFKIYLPVAGAVPELPQPTGPEVRGPAATGVVLLVEDEDQVRHLTRT
ncbi:MAG TPA: ATP-binding protein, partial [Bryobacteraceae bacterium]